MKTLLDYHQPLQTAALEKHGGFFAFSTLDFNKKKRPGVQYVNLGMGLVAPESQATDLKCDLDRALAEAIKMDLADHGKKSVIRRALANTEAQLTGCIDDALLSLSGYGISADEVQAEWPGFLDACEANGCF